MKLIVEQHSHFGKVYFYPVNDISKQLLEAFPWNKNKTRESYTHDMLKKLKKIGFDIEVKQPKSLEL